MSAQPYVIGRVVDGEGRPVAGARVALGHSFRGEDEPLHTTTSAADGAFAFDRPEVGKLGERRDRPLAVRADEGARVSRKVVLDWGAWPLDAGDLALRPAADGRIEARWEDGSPAAGVNVDLTLLESYDDDAELLHFRGVTDEGGRFPFGPFRDRAYAATLRAEHAAGPPRQEQWESIPAGRVLPLAMERGREIRGCLVTHDGRPGAGFRVAPWSPKTGDPEEAVVADGEGRFELDGVDAAETGIAIYAPVPPPPDDALARIRHFGQYGGWPTNPIEFHAVPAGVADIGTVPLPPLGTLELRLEHADGEPVAEGHVFWSHPGVPHGMTASFVEPDGVARFESVPRGRRIGLKAIVAHPTHGELEERFQIDEVKDEPVRRRVTGAGTVIVRFLTGGRPVEVPRASARWHDSSGLRYHRSPTSELRGWREPGLYPWLAVSAAGFPKRVVQDVRVLDDGPTCIDVDLYAADS